MEPRELFRNTYELIKTVAIVFVLSFLIRTFLVQTFIVQGKSMEPTFFNRNYLLVDKISFRLHEPVRGDILVFRNPENRRVDFVKRVIALPGEKISIRNGQVSVDGQLITEAYIHSQHTDADQANFEAVLASNQYFVMGDNRENSLDSRRIGAINRNDILGKVFLRVLPLRDFELIRGPA